MLTYFGDVVFAISGALAAGRRRLDLVGYLMVGIVTGIGGGTLRDLILHRPVWWTRDPLELWLCAGAAFATYFIVPDSIRRYRAIKWFDALGLACFSVVGSSIALKWNAHATVAVFLGMVTCTGGGVIRDLLINVRPMILCGELYALAAGCGALSYVVLKEFETARPWPSVVGFLVTFLLRGAAIVFGVRLGPPGQFLRIGRPDMYEVKDKWS